MTSTHHSQMRKHVSLILKRSYGPMALYHLMMYVPRCTSVAMVITAVKILVRIFNVRIGTIFENTKIPLRKWFLTMYFVANHKKGISATQLSSDIGVTLKTAWFLLQKVRRTLHRGVHRIKLDGEVELDETFVGGKK